MAVTTVPDTKKKTKNNNIQTRVHSNWTRDQQLTSVLLKMNINEFKAIQKETESYKIL